MNYFKEQKMYATEFQTVINNQYIKILEYERFKRQEVGIIVLHIEVFDNYVRQKDKKILQTALFC